MKDILPSHLLTIQDAATILGVSTKTLRRWDAAGVLTPQRTSGNQRRYTKDQIDIFKKKREAPYGVPSSLGPSHLEGVVSQHLPGGEASAPFRWPNGLLKGDGSEGQVLQAATIDNTLFFNVNIPSKFAEDAEFLRGISAVEIATLSGGILTNNADIDAGTGILTASNVLYDVIAGAGIAITEGQTPTITNTDLGSSQNIFKTIKVGSTTFSTGSNSDTLELAAGSNITLSTDTSNKKVTITGATPTSSGWTDDGTTVRLTTSTDSVGIGTTSPLEVLHVVGNATASGNLTLSGAARSIQATAFNALTIGGSTTGNITLSPQNGGASGILNLNTTNLQIAGTAGSTVSTAACVTTVDGIVTGSDDCPIGETSIHWNSTNGALVPKITTHDLLLGGTATTSAKFGVLNMNNGTPTASISANSGNNATTLTGTGVLGTTNAQTLQIGNSTTGNILVSANSNANSAFRITDGTNAYFTLDTRTTNSGTSALTLAAGTAPTIASAATAEYTTLTLTPPTITLTGTTQVTSQMDSILFSAPTITDASAVTVDRAATFAISAAPSAGGSLIIANDLAFSVVAGNIGYGANSMLMYGAINDKLIDDMEAITDWTASDGTNTPVSLESTIVKTEAGAMKITTVAGSSINDTVKKDMGFTADLSSVDRIGFWIRPSSTVSGQLISVQFSEDDVTYQDNNITIDQSDKWVYHEWDISGITGTSRDAVRYYRFNIDRDEGSPTFYIDQMRYYDKDNRAAEVYVDASGRLQISGEQGFDIITNIASSRPSISANAATVEINQPLNVNVGGDVGIDYDLQFLNTGTANITSEGPLSILAGDANHAENLTLGTQGTGDVVVDINDSVAAGGFKILGSSGYVFRINPSGKTGIGTIDPLASLDIRPNITDGGTIAVASASGATSFAALLADNTGVGDIFTASKSGDTKFLINNAGNVGIGDRGPDNLLDVMSSTLNAAIAITSTGTDTDALLKFELADDTPNFVLGVDDSDSDKFKIGTSAIDTNTRLTIDSSGLFGINTTSPLATFDIREVSGTLPVASVSGQTSFAAMVVDNTGVGDIFTASKSGETKFIIRNNGLTALSMNGTATAFALCHSGTDLDAASNELRDVVPCTDAPGDIAEWYEVKGDAEGGDIMAVSDEMFTYQATQIDPYSGQVSPNKKTTKVAKLERADSAKQNKIIGIVSTSPWRIMGGDIRDQGLNPKPIALSGRTTVKVSTENGAIQPGDFLTISSTPGVAMKSTKAGTVIGKALENFDTDGIGKIVMFVNLTWHDPSVYIAADGNLVGVNQESVLASQGEALQPQSASTSAQATFDLGSDPLFKDLSDKVNLLEARINNLSDTALSASTSALLSEIQESSVGEIGEIGDIGGIEEATLSGTLTVLGRTTVNDLGVTGNINAGLLAINGLDPSTGHSTLRDEPSGSDSKSSGQVGATINTLSGNLYLQNRGLGGIDILDGKIVIDTDGNIKVEGTVTAKEVKTEKVTIITDTTVSGSAVLSDSAGSVIIKAGILSVDVDTTALTPDSLIFATPEKAVAVGTKRKDKDTFTISLQEPLSEAVKVSWWVVN